jgi:6-phospho-beta-glucosidase
VNYYQPRRVKCRDSAVNPQAPFMPEWFFDNYEMPGRKMNPYRGWEIYAPGIYDILVNLRDNYGNPRCFISKTAWVSKMNSALLKMARLTINTVSSLFLSI